MKNKEEIISKINGLSFRTVAFMKNVITITKKCFEDGKISKENYGEAVFSFKVLKENIVKCEVRIINLIEDYNLEQKELKQTLDLLMYGREILRAAKKSIKFLKRVRNEGAAEAKDADEIKNLIDIYDIFITECDLMKVDINSEKEPDIQVYKAAIEEMVIKRDFQKIKENFFMINEYFSKVGEKISENLTVETEHQDDEE